MSEEDGEATTLAFDELEGHVYNAEPVDVCLRGAPIGFGVDPSSPCGILVIKITLIKAQLLSVPPKLFLFPSLQILSLSSNRIKTLPEKGWSSLLALEEVDVSHNQIKLLPPELSEAKAIRILNLRSNDLRHFVEHCIPVLRTMPSLEHIDLRYNKSLRGLTPSAIEAQLERSLEVLCGAEKGVPWRRGLEA